MSDKVIVSIGEYTIIEDLSNGVFKCLRNGEEWRDLVGDNMVLALVSKINNQQEALKEILELSKHDGISRYLDKVYVIARKELEASE